MMTADFWETKNQPFNSFNSVPLRFDTLRDELFLSHNKLLAD